MTQKKEVKKEVSKEEPQPTFVSKQQVEKLRSMPVIETKITTSKDGKWVIHETIIKSIKPAAYYQAVIDNEGGDEQ